MKYLRTYPWGFQLMIFLLMVFTLISSASVIIYSLFTKLSGYLPTQLGSIGPNSPAELVNAAIVVQAASSIFIFLLPAFLFAYLATPRPAEYLGLRKPGKMIQPILAILVMLSAMPVLEWMSGLISHIDFGPGVKASQQVNDDMMNAFLNTPTLSAFIKVFVVMAIIPGMGEEMFFRGILMRFARKKTKNMTAPIIFTALVFAFVHTNIYGYLSIFLAGVLLGVIYNLTGSLWCSILAHLFFNGTQVVLSYASNFNPAIKTFLNNPNTSYSYVIGGGVVFCISFYLLLKNKTPLAKDWAEDYTAAELQQSE